MVCGVRVLGVEVNSGREKGSTRERKRLYAASRKRRSNLNFLYTLYRFYPTIKKIMVHTKRLGPPGEPEG